MDAAAEFQTIRPRLFGVAYRILGRAADAEDVVQDVWVRWQGTDRSQVRDPLAFLVTVTTRVALTVAVSARARHEVLVDGWQAEPVLTAGDPTRLAELSSELEHAVLLLLRRLSPVERAVLVLREAFEYPFRDIADALRMSEANARQHARRARAHLAQPRRRPVRRSDRDRLTTAFLGAARVGDVARLEHLLADAVHAGSRGTSAA